RAAAGGGAAAAAREARVPGRTPDRRSRPARTRRCPSPRPVPTRRSRGTRRRALRLHPGEGGGEGLCALCARDAVPAVDDEERDALDAVGARLVDVRLDRGPVLVRREGAAHVLGVEADVGRERDELVEVPHVATLDEVRGEEPLDELELLAVRLRVVQG